MVTTRSSMLMGAACMAQGAAAGSAGGFLRRLSKDMWSLANDLNAEIAGGAATCDDTSFTGCGIILRTVDWESNNALFYRASAQPRQEGQTYLPWLQNKVSTMIANAAMLPQPFGESIVGNIGVIYNPQSAGAVPVCGFAMDGWVDMPVRQAFYDGGNGIAWNDGVDGCGACFSYTPDDDVRCLALQWDYLSTIDQWISGPGEKGACPDPANPELAQQASPCTAETFNPGLAKAYMPPSDWSWESARLPWSDILWGQIAKQSAEDHNSFQWSQSSYTEILLSLADLESSPDGVRGFYVDGWARSMDTPEKLRLVQIAMDQCITFNRDHPDQPTPLLWLDFDTDSGTYFVFASDCTTPGDASSDTSVKLVIESAQQIGRGHAPLQDHEGTWIWELDANTGVTQNMCFDLPNWDMAASPSLWNCDGESKQTWGYNTQTNRIFSEVDSSKCVAVQEGHLVMQDCDESDPSQYWEMPISGIGQIKTYVDGAEYCLDADGGVTWAMPSQLVLAGCVPDPAKDWPSQLFAMHCKTADGWDVPCGQVTA